MEAHNIFTDDLIEDILLRLPVRYLLRFRCISKSWCGLIDSTRFIKKHHQIQSVIPQEEGDMPLILISQSLDYQSLDYDEVQPQFYLLSKKQTDPILCLTPDLDRDSDRVSVHDLELFNRCCCMGVVNGVVGLCWGDDCLGLWNPATREFKVVPPPRQGGIDSFIQLDYDILGFAYDPKSNDFKIVRSMYWDEIGYLCEMYSLSTNSWKRLELPSSPYPHRRVDFPSSTDRYYNGAYYWTAVELDWDYCPQRYVILSFDFSRVAFEFLDPPHAVAMAVAATDDVGDFDWMVGLYMERFAMIICYQNWGVELHALEIWVASESYVGDGSKNSLSWQHLFNIEPPSWVYGVSFVAFRMDGDVLLNFNDDSEKQESNIYNPSTRTFKHLNGLSFHSGYKYVESLFSLSERRIQGYTGMDKLKKRKRNQNHELDELGAMKPQLAS